MDFPVLVEELNDAVAYGTVKRRSDILARITDLFALRSVDYSDEQIEVFDDVFVRLVATLELTARSALSRRLARDPHAPLAISHILASDDEIDIAGPMLEHSQRLDNEMLVATAKTKSQQHLLAISRRQLLDEAVTDVLVEHGNNTVVLSTVANPAARFSEGGYMKLVRRSEVHDEIVVSVALRRDMPHVHLMRLLVRASDPVRRKLEAADPQMADFIQNDAVSQSLAAARSQMESLHAVGRLGEQEVAAFASAKQAEETSARAASHPASCSNASPIFRN